MVPRRRLELPRPCERQHLKLVRLPIPPPGHVRSCLNRARGNVNGGRARRSCLRALCRARPHRLSRGRMPRPAGITGPAGRSDERHGQMDVDSADREMMESMRPTAGMVTVFGGSGFLGRHIVHARGGGAATGFAWRCAARTMRITCGPWALSGRSSPSRRIFATRRPCAWLCAARSRSLISLACCMKAASRHSTP